jgi:predicted enzyme related to lactoylglutathione lyase
MMHRSRLAGFIIDCRTDDLEGAAEFWSRALGVKTQRQPDETKYINFERYCGLHIEVQKVEHDSRVHLDIETDDVEAEVLRLEGLGAKRVAKIRTWWVMEAPTGQRFCVVRPQGPELARDGNVWE